MFLGKGAPKICSKFTGEHPCRSAISIKLQSNFIEITFQHGCPLVNLLHIFRTPFPKNIYGRLLLFVLTRWLHLVLQLRIIFLVVDFKYVDRFAGNFVSFLFYVEIFRKNCITIENNDKFFINIFPIFFVISIYNVKILITIEITTIYMLSSYIKICVIICVIILTKVCQVFKYPLSIIWTRLNCLTVILHDKLFD